MIHTSWITVISKTWVSLWLSRLLLGLPGPRNWSVPRSRYILGSQTPCTTSDVPIHEVMVKREDINNAEFQKM